MSADYVLRFQLYGTGCDIRSLSLMCATSIMGPKPAAYSLCSHGASLLPKLPDDCPPEDIQGHLYIREKVRRGLDGAAAEVRILQEEAGARLGSVSPRAIWSSTELGPAMQFSARPRVENLLHGSAHVPDSRSRHADRRGLPAQ